MMTNDFLEKFNNEIIERRLLKVDRQFTAQEINQLRKTLAESPPGIVVPSENPIKELKHKKGIPTVIEYQGRRYVLDHADNRK